MREQYNTAFRQYVNDTLRSNAKPVSYYLELERQQILDAYDEGKYLSDGTNFNGETYYNNKFKNI